MQILFKCDICGSEFASQTDCLRCEISHSIVSPRFSEGITCESGYTDWLEVRYPTILNVEMANGRVCQYEFIQENKAPIK